MTEEQMERLNELMGKPSDELSDKEKEELEELWRLSDPLGDV